MKTEEVVVLALLLGGAYYIYKKHPDVIKDIEKILPGKGGGGGSGGSGGGSGGSTSGGGGAAVPGKDIYPSAGGASFTSASLKDGQSWSAGKASTSAVSVINSNATAKFSGGVLSLAGDSPRFYIPGPWKPSIEFTAYIKGGGSDVMLVGPSNHEVRPGGFGGYYFYISDAGTTTSFKKEIFHGNGYTSALDKKPFKHNTSIWTGMKLVTRQSGKNIIVEGYIDEGSGWKKTNSVTDSGNLRGAPFTGTAKWVFIRSNSPKNLQVKDISVRNITPAGATSSIAYSYVSSYHIPERTEKRFGLKIPPRYV